MTDLVVKGLSGLAAFVALFFLGWILYEVVIQGVSAFNLDFFTKLPRPPGFEGGGLANAMLGTVIITFMATVLGVPVGIMSGVYLSEFGRSGKLETAVRFFANVLMGTPSIIIGIFVYSIIVVPMKSFSGYAGAVALAFIMLPVVTRTTEDMLNLVPNELRESALALGAPRWKVTTGIVFRAAKTGLVTGVVLAIARVSGETAPLLFTAFNSTLTWPTELSGPTPNLTVTIFNYAMSPYKDWKAQAWGASLLIMGAILVLTVVSRVIFKKEKV
jgi:phosphate transport system permease protein